MTATADRDTDLPAEFGIDETGGEATAATGATVVSKSLPLNVRKCAIDRPFVFAITHKPTGAPVFMGKVANPAAK